MNKGIVAIVGTPNVGKSTLFNRIIGQRHAIVDDESGITRDRLYGKASWLTQDFTIIDTGGIEIKNAPFQKQIRLQVELAIEEADVILYVADGKLGITDDDRFICKMLYKTYKPVILAVNKIDNKEMLYQVNEFYALGLGDPIPTSSTHGIGIGDILDKIIELLPEKKEKIYENAICFSIIGRPNVGKSSLTNAILNQERVIVSDIEGTTRDSIDTSFKRDGQNYVVIDTAGLKKRGRIYEAIDKYSALRALSSIDRSQIVLLVIDAESGVTNQDKHVVGYAMEENKAIIIVVNKWDLVEHNENSMNDFSKKIRKEFKFLDYAPIVYLSAKNKSRIQTLFPEIILAYNSYNFRVGTSVLNDIIADAQIMNPTPIFNGGRLKIYFALQVSTCPPTFILSVNNPDYMHFSYERYIENRLRDSFEFTGSPLKIVCRARK